MEGGGSCPSCGCDTTHLSSERIVLDACGHYKCRKCLLNEDHGCATCRVQSELREPPERHSVIVSRKPSASYSFGQHLDQSPVPSPWVQEPTAILRPDEAPVHDESSNTNPAIVSTTQSSYSDGNERQTNKEANDLVKDWICSVNFTTHREPVTENQDPDSEPCDVPDSDHDAIIQRGKQVSQKFLSEILSSALSINDGGKKRVRRKRSFRPEEYHHISKGLNLDGNVSYTCTICNRSFSNKFNIRYHIPCADESARYACTHCDRTFKSSSHLTYHVRSVHSGERPYKCEECSKTFTQLVKLKRHSRLHTGERPFVCDICNKSFKTNYHLKEHRNIHNVDQHHGCAHCSKKFADKNNLRRHMKIFHKDGQDSGRFRCKIRNCNSRFVKGNELEEHKKVVHGLVNKFPCDTCQQLFQTSKDLERHKNIHTDTKAFRCTFCYMSFRRKDNLQRHQKLLHKNCEKEKNVSLSETPFSSSETKSELHIKAVPMDDIEEDGKKTYVNLSTVASGHFKSEYDFSTAQGDSSIQPYVPENNHNPLSMDTTKSCDGLEPLNDHDRLGVACDRIDMSSDRMEMNHDRLEMSQDRLEMSQDKVDVPNIISSSKLHQFINKYNLPDLETMITNFTEGERQAFRQLIKEEDFQEENQALRLTMKEDDPDENHRPHKVKKDFLNRYRKQSGIPPPASNNSALEALQHSFPSGPRSSATMSARASSFGRASQSISSLERERILQGPLDMPEIAMDDNQRLLMMNSLASFVESLKEGNASKAGESLVLENGKVETNRASTVIRMTPHGLRKLTVFDEEEDNN